MPSPLEVPANLEPLFPARLVTGILPRRGGISIGQYFGAVRQYVGSQYEYPGDAFCVVADYHALTAEHRPASLAQSVRATALDYLALGLDPGVSTLYQQSDVPQTCELMWILGCTANAVRRLDRGHPYRTAVEQGHGASLGLFLYPALLAADILTLRATDVALPHGQEPMLEMAREFGRSFNQRLRVVFPLPSLRRPPATAPGGADPRETAAGYHSELPVFWTDEDDFEARVMEMATSAVPLGEPIDPDTCSVFALYRLVADSAMTAEMRTGFERGRLGYRDAKRMLVDALRHHFAPHHERRRQMLQADTSTIDELLDDGARRVREEAEATLDAVRECIGLASYRRRFV